MVGEGDQVRLSATGDLEKAAGALAARSWVRQAKALDGASTWCVENASTELPAILTDVAAAGAIVRSVEVAEPDLEAVFLHLTAAPSGTRGKPMRAAWLICAKDLRPGCGTVRPS
jgi:ABC-2 type transport system ATP-binding protein